MNQDGGYHDQQEAAELLLGVNAASSQFVLTEVALKTSWEAEPDGEERERQQERTNAFRHARSVLQAMTADRGRAGTQAMTAEHALLGCKPAGNPGKPERCVRRRFRGAIKRIRHPQPHDRGTRREPSKRERTPPRKKAAKKTRTPAERAAARAAKRVDEMEAATIAAEAAAYETAGSGHAAEQEEDDSAAEPGHARPHPCAS
jgi:hypothetical protein